MAEMVKLMTSDGELVEVEKDVAVHSVLIRGIIEDSGAEEDIPLPQVKKAILEKIIVYCKYITQNAPPEIDKPLRELACAKVASVIKGMSIPEIRDYFHIENDFTPEEEAQIMDENRWAEESF